MLITLVLIFSDPSPYPRGTESPSAIPPAALLHFQEIITEYLCQVQCSAVPDCTEPLTMIVTPAEEQQAYYTAPEGSSFLCPLYKAANHPTGFG